MQRQDLTPEQQAKHDKGLCIMKDCTNTPEEYRKICHKCRTKMYKLRYPVRYYYYELKKKAKRRMIPFDLTYKEWELFCFETDYINKVGRNADDCSIDRIKAHLGYCYSNMQLLTVSENSKKRHEVDYSSVILIEVPF